MTDNTKLVLLVIGIILLGSTVVSAFDNRKQIYSQETSDNRDNYVYSESIPVNSNNSEHYPFIGFFFLLTSISIVGFE